MKNSKDIGHYLDKLVGFKTLTDNFSEHEKVIRWIKSEIKGLPLNVKVIKSKKSSSVIITTKKTSKPKLLLAGHLDVVPGPDKLFDLKLSKGRYIGRGVFDMKYAVACYIKLLKDLGDEISKYDLGVLITTDEETGGFNGTKYILEQGLRPKVCLLPDGGTDWQMIKAAKGIWQIKIKSSGKSAHSSKPWMGKSASLELINFLSDLNSKFKNEPCGDKIHLHPTMNVSNIESGKTINKIPDSAGAILDIRYLDDRQLKKIKTDINNLKKRYSRIRTETLVLENNFEANLSNKYFDKFFKIAKRHGIKKKTMITHGSSDVRHFAKYKIPTIVFRPKGNGHHTDDEWINIKDTERFYKVLKDFVIEVS